MRKASERILSTQLQFWDGIAAGMGLALVPLTVHLTPSNDVELLGGVVLATVVLSVAFRRRFFSVPQRPGRRRGGALVALLLVIVGLPIIIASSWFVTLRLAHLRDVDDHAGVTPMCVAFEEDGSVESQCEAQEKEFWERVHREDGLEREALGREVHLGSGMGLGGLLLVGLGGFLDLRWRRSQTD